MSSKYCKCKIYGLQNVGPFPAGEIASPVDEECSKEEPIEFNNQNNHNQEFKKELQH